MEKKLKVQKKKIMFFPASVSFKALDTSIVLKEEKKRLTKGEQKRYVSKQVFVALKL